MKDELVLKLLGIVKKDNFIDDNTLDDVLMNYLKQAGDMVCLYIAETELPSTLETVVVRMAENHYIQTMNDADGDKSYTEEGASWTFNDNDLTPFISLLEKYLDSKNDNYHRGELMSW